MKVKFSVNCSIQLEVPSVQAHTSAMLLSQTITKPKREISLPVLLAMKLPWADPDRISALNESAGPQHSLCVKESHAFASGMAQPANTSFSGEKLVGLLHTAAAPWKTAMILPCLLLQVNCPIQVWKVTWKMLLLGHMRARAREKNTSPNSLWDDISVPAHP